MIMEENFRFTAAFCANIIAGFRLLDGAGLERLKNDLERVSRTNRGIFIPCFELMKPLLSPISRQNLNVEFRLGAII